MKLIVSRRWTLPWESQVGQYPARGPKGISYFAGVVPEGTVDCLLYRDKSGKVRGILNYYATDFPPHERAGNVNVLVDPKWQRRGIASKLLSEAQRRWTINWEQQAYTEAGARLVQAFLHEPAALGPEFVRAQQIDPGMTPETLARDLGIPLDLARPMFEDQQRELEQSEHWVNDTYQVIKRREGPVWYLSIRRNDRAPIHDWRELQKIKSALVGPENEGFELYPAESRVVDTANQYHLFVYADAAVRIPFGFTAGARTEASVGRSRQRPFST